MFQWMQNLGAKMGEPLPQALFLPPRPPKDIPVSTSIPMSTHSHTHSHTHTSTHTHSHTHQTLLIRQIVFLIGNQIMDATAGYRLDVCHPREKEIRKVLPVMFLFYNNLIETNKKSIVVV